MVETRKRWREQGGKTGSTSQGGIIGPVRNMCCCRILFLYNSITFTMWKKETSDGNWWKNFVVFLAWLCLTLSYLTGNRLIIFVSLWL